MAKYSNGREDSLDIPDSSVTVLESRYLAKDWDGNIIETGEELFRRVAKDIAVAELLYSPEFRETAKGLSSEELYELAKDSSAVKEREEEFFNIMTRGYFLPNSPTLMNAGKKLQQLSACFVLPVGDSMEEIFDALKNMAIVHKTGGGTGFAFSRLRPNGAFINSTQGYSPGPLSFLFGFNESAGQITQGGKRRGANMGIIRANHPDALCWARIKEEEGVLSNFNLSIAFSDKEMEEVKDDGYILMEDPREGKNYTIENAKKRVKEIHFGKGDKFKISWKVSEDETKIIDTYSEDEIGKIEDGLIYLKARKLFGVIVEGAWKKGEPGIIFIDKMNQGNPTPEVGEIESTNPCGEQPLLPYESCNLGSIDLSKMINDLGQLDDLLLEKTIRSAVRFLDNVIDRNKYSLEEIEKITKANRKIGLGVMGFAHMLIKLGISYNSSKAVEMAGKVMKFINDVSKDESKKLAKERGAFPNFYRSIYRKGELMRNATTTTIAPTGTTGVIASTSQGIEPIFRLITLRNVKNTIGKDLIEVDRAFREYLTKKNLYDEELILKIEEKGLNLEDIKEFKEIKEEMKKLFVTTHKIEPEQHIKIQAAFQKHTDNAVSKTINMPNESTIEDIANAYFMAHELGCKGMTVYRDGSRDIQLLTSLKKEKKKDVTIFINQERPNLIGTTIKQQTPHGKAFITLNCMQNSPLKPYEAFINIGKGGKDIPAIAEGFGRLLSLALQTGVPLEDILAQLEDISGETQTGFGPQKIYSLPDAIAKGLKEAVSQLKIKEFKMKTPEEEIIEEIEELDVVGKGERKISGNFCPECGGVLMFIEGCQKCNCGYSKC